MTRGKPNPEYFGKPPKAVRAFQVHRTNALRRGIPFLFTFTEWWAWWQVDDRWSNRGMGRDKFVMARINDKGPYSPENVYCATHAENVGEIAIIDREGLCRKTKEAWARGVNFNIPKGTAHVRSQAIQTPDGIFANATEAAEHYGITRQGARNRAKTRTKGWRYAECVSGEPVEAA